MDVCLDMRYHPGVLELIPVVVSLQSPRIEKVLTTQVPFSQGQRWGPQRPSQMKAMKRFAVLLVLVIAAGAHAAHISKRLDTAKKGAWKGYVRYPQFKGNTPLIRFANAQILKEAKADIAAFIDEVHDLPIEGSSISEIEGSYWIELETPAIISVRLGDARYPAGYHPNYNARRINVAIVNGKPAVLKLTDIVRSPKKLVDIVAKRLVAGGKGDEPYKPMFFGVQDLLFLIHPKGLYFFYERGEKATSYVGPLIAEIPWSKVPGLRRDGPVRAFFTRR